MAGTFVLGETKIRPGVYHRRDTSDAAAGDAVVNGIGAGGLRANWGPINEVVTLTSPDDASRIFGSGEGVALIMEMFAGGISTGKFVRVGTGGKAPSVVLKDDAEADCVTITGAYAGDRAFSVSVRDSLAGDGRECIIYEGTAEFLKVRFAGGSGEGNALVAALNAATSDFKATLTAAGSGVLAAVTQAAFSGGQNPTAAAEQYSAGLAALEATDYNVVCVDTEDAAIHALLHAFVDRTYEAGSFPIACVAEKQSVELATRMEHAAAYDDEKMVYCLNGTYAGTELLDGYRLAARIGGMIAAVEANVSLTHKAVTGCTAIAEPLTNTQIETALRMGCLVLSESAAGEVRVEQGINTLVHLPDNMDAGWKKIRRVKTRFEMMRRMTAAADAIIGGVDNDANGRSAVLAVCQGVANTMIGEGKLQEGTAVSEASTGTQEVDGMGISIEVQDVDSIEKIYLFFRFRSIAVTVTTEA